MSLGAEKAGVVTKFAVELHHAAFETYRYNHPQCTVLQMGVEHLQNLAMPFAADDLSLKGTPRSFHRGGGRSRTSGSPGLQEFDIRSLS
ncbi:DNA cytosine methyltransferase [Gluconacetobacter diazotrophicus]|uniref:DNA cytosine methyltransferase n=1 Tax=Gluconacetobacter diazotrophicus TaxID=33996 RepID=UPI0009DA0019